MFIDCADPLYAVLQIHCGKSEGRSLVVAGAEKDAERDGFHMLGDLNTSVHGPIEVMVCWKWEASNAYGKFLSAEYLVSDVKGTVFHCTAWRSVAHCFVDSLEEGKVYTLNNFTVIPNRDTYRVCRDNTFMIQLEGNTVVRHSKERSMAGFERYPFQFAPFEDICFVEHKYVIDVIGTMTTTGTSKTTRAGSSFLDCYLLDVRGASIRITLWGNHCSELLARTEARQSTFPVIFTGMNIKEYRGDAYLSSTSATLIYTDARIPAITRFQQQLSKAPVQSQVGPKVGSLTELLSHGREEKVARKRGKRMSPVTYLCTAKIASIRTKNRWYYYSCNLAKCRKGITRNGGNFFCESCAQAIEFPLTRYKLQMDVTNDSGTIVITLFDDVAEKLVKKDASILLRESGHDVDEAILPQDIQQLVDTSHTFELKTYTYYDHGTYESFTCTAVTEATTKIGLGVNSPATQLLKRPLDPVSTDALDAHNKSQKSDHPAVASAAGKNTHDDHSKSSDDTATSSSTP